MLTKMQKSAFVIVAGIMAMLVWSLHPAVAAEDGSGIWTYDAGRTISLVNLTNYPLTYLKVEEGGASYPAYWGCGAHQEMLDAGKDWQVEPFRTKLWWSSPTHWYCPTAFDGKITLYSNGFSDWKFDLVFVGQHGNNTAGLSGTWTALYPHAANQGWASANTWSTGRWATPVDGSVKKMYNVMTLISPKIMVTLYSGDNVNITVVVQQLYEKNEVGGTLWDDTGIYEGNQLDFVDNGSSSVPGQ